MKIALVMKKLKNGSQVFPIEALCLRYPINLKKKE